MRKLIYILLILVTFNACSEYQRVLKSENIADKFKLGVALYEAGKFKKANALFQQIVPNYKGKPQAEKLMFLYANTFLELEDYYSAGYQFERFTSAYPKSEKAEEASYKSALGYYMLSPVYSKEQKETYEALEKLQLFANIYPQSQYLDEVNKMVKELDYKLEKKAFEIASQYHKIAPTRGTYQASIKSFNNFLLDFPGSSFKEEAMYLRYKSAQEYAEKSVEWKKEERLKQAQEYLNTFKNSYPASTFLEENNSEAEEDTKNEMDNEASNN